MSKPIFEPITRPCGGGSLTISRTPMATDANRTQFACILDPNTCIGNSPTIPRIAAIGNKDGVRFVYNLGSNTYARDIDDELLCAMYYDGNDLNPETLLEEIRRSNAAISCIGEDPPAGIIADWNLNHGHARVYLPRLANPAGLELSGNTDAKSGSMGGTIPETLKQTGKSVLSAITRPCNGGSLTVSRITLMPTKGRPAHEHDSVRFLCNLGPDTYVSDTHNMHLEQLYYDGIDLAPEDLLEALDVDVAITRLGGNPCPGIIAQWDVQDGAGQHGYVKTYLARLAKPEPAENKTNIARDERVAALEAEVRELRGNVVRGLDSRVIALEAVIRNMHPVTVSHEARIAALERKAHVLQLANTGSDACTMLTDGDMRAAAMLLHARAPGAAD